jgi:hypothetical protein
MKLTLCDNHRGYDIYKNEEDHFIVFDTNDPILPKEKVNDTIRLFVMQDIDINMKILSWSMYKASSELDIDVAEVLSRSPVQNFL